VTTIRRGTCAPPSRFEVRGSRFEVRGSRFEVRGSRFEVRGSRFEVRGSRFGFEVRGSRFEVRGSRFEVSTFLLHRSGLPFHAFVIPSSSLLAWQRNQGAVNHP